ncbi:hypothetical protein CUMW_120800 [Citrus unshiu]|nr:hypothetical protein CUMW_120800 [Citrus unshiu]
MTLTLKKNIMINTKYKQHFGESYGPYALNQEEITKWRRLIIRLLQGRGLLPSDNLLVTQDHRQGEIIQLVWAHASDQQFFCDSFVNSIVKVGKINVLTGHHGQIRNDCRFVNKEN